MKNRTIRILLTLAFFTTIFSCKDKTSTPTKYDYEIVDGDPLNVHVYTLDNGLKVYLSVNKDEPRIQTNIAVNTGSKQDPADATGLAHYLEHMLFKGTSKMATIDWEKEKVLLKQISDLYEKRRSVEDEEKRKSIYREIDSLSNVAARYAVPNEYDKMISSLGAKGTNAYTSLERTVYVNDIPSNELEKWMKIESERFSELVLRLFHTELEAVYEEYNRTRDNDGRLAYEVMMQELFKKHPYGTQTTIGTSEHLKNPSMEKIHHYFNERYVPNNMAIVLSGDLDPDNTIDLIKKYFGAFQPKEVPAFTFEPEDEISEPKYVTLYGNSSEWVDIGFRLPGVDAEDNYILPLMDGLLANGQAGLIDLNLVKGQKILSGYSTYSVSKDYSRFMLHARPKAGQTLDEAKDLLLAELNKIKKGEFEDWMLPAVIKNFKLGDQLSNVSNKSRAGKMTDAFIKDQKWENIVKSNDKLSTITKQQIVDFANKYLNDNYVVVYKKTGKGNHPKVEKPAITQLTLNRDTSSLFAQEFENMKSARIAPVFDDFKTAIHQDKLNANIPFYYVKNTTNETFELRYILDMGSFNDKEMALAINYLEYLGTDRYSANELQTELFKLGLNYSVSASTDRIYVTLTGLEESLEDGIQLFEHIIANVQEDQEAYNSMVKGILKTRTDNKLSKRNILYGGLMNYGTYGEDAPIKNLLSDDALKQMSTANLTDKIKQLTSFEHYVYYYGVKDEEEVKQLISKYHKTPEKLNPLPPAKKYEQLETTTNKVYFVDYDMVQSEILMLSKVKPYNPEELSLIRVFNEYFGSGLSSIVFQEIRESKALAYAAYSYYTVPRKLDESHYVRAYIGTQVDKLGDATNAILTLMDSMPLIENQFDDSKKSAMKRIETSRTKSSSLFWKYLVAKEMGHDTDTREKVYDELSKVDLQQLNDFFNKNIKGKNYTFLVIGSKDKMDMQALENLGEVQELSLEELFGY